MDENPWNVGSVQDFSFLNCPECNFKTKEDELFQCHAVASHPMCYVLFGDTKIVVQEVKQFKQKKTLKKKSKRKLNLF